MLRRLPARIVVLAERDMRHPRELLELIKKGVVVLGKIFPSAQWTEVRHLEAPVGLDLEDLALVLVLLPLVLPLPDDLASLPPVGYDLRPEHVFLDLLRIGKRRPHLRRLRVDLDLGGRYVISHDLLLLGSGCRSLAHVRAKEFADVAHE